MFSLEGGLNYSFCSFNARPRGSRGSSPTAAVTVAVYLFVEGAAAAGPPYLRRWDREPVGLWVG